MSILGLEQTVPALQRLGDFDAVLDIGGNDGRWAELARYLWPNARVTSFEPVPFIARANRERSGGRWWVENLALTDEGPGETTMHVCLNQHSVSTLQAVGTVRRQAFGIVDRWETVTVKTDTLDHYLRGWRPDERTLIKIDVEGHEGKVLAGAATTLRYADAVVVEVQQSPDIFEGAATPGQVDELLSLAGLRFSGVIDSLSSPKGELLQFDGLWLRDR